MNNLVNQLLGGLETADDITLLGKAGDNWRFIVPFRGDLAEECYEESVALNNDLPEFQEYYAFNKRKNQIRGSSTFHSARLNRVLRPKGLALPNVLDLKILEKEGKLPGGVYINAGVVVYTKEEPNKETAIALMEKARQKGWDLPLFWSPEDLDYNISQGHAKIISVDNPKRVISGDKAKNVLMGFNHNYIVDSGALAAFRGAGGYWYAGWDDFAFSYSLGLVGFVCAEGTPKNLVETYNHLCDRERATKPRELTTRIAGLKAKCSRRKQSFLEKLEA